MIKFFPTQYIKSISDIDFEKVYQLGYRAIIFDIDATLVPHGAKVTPEVENLFQQLKEIGFKTLLLSNNSESRVTEFNKNIQTNIIYDAEKPKSDGFLKALDMLNIEKEYVLMVGDQLFTDILGANKCGIKNILVDFLPQVGEKKLGKKRSVEKILMKFYPIFARNQIGDIENRKNTP